MNTPCPPHVAFAAFLQQHPRLVVLTGAGVSADSGIPTYRDDSGKWLYKTPIQHQDFIRDEQTRKRYWSRSIGGWPAIHGAQPNDAHKALTQLESQGHIELLITQNVDRLHQRAGSKQVVDLHGRLDKVRCLDCGTLSCRETLQSRLLALNGPLAAATSAHEARPDGDTEFEQEDYAHFRVPNCAHCAGTLMPEVVFYGGTVPKDRVENCMAALERADGLLVVGSSLQVYSGYRFSRKASGLNKAIAIINRGKTRADDLATLKLSVPADVVLCG